MDALQRACILWGRGARHGPFSARMDVRSLPHVPTTHKFSIFSAASRLSYFCCRVFLEEVGGVVEGFCMAVIARSWRSTTWFARTGVHASLHNRRNMR